MIEVAMSGTPEWLAARATGIGAARSSGSSKRIFEAREDRVAASKRLDDFLDTLKLVQK